MSKFSKIKKSAFLKLCLFVNLILGTATALFFYLGADFLSLRVLNATDSGNCLKILSVGIPFMAMKGAIHGYFLGLERSEVHGISDFLEQITKIGGLYIIATYIIVTRPFTASFAVLGIVLGEFIAFLYSFIMLVMELRHQSLSNDKMHFNTMGSKAPSTRPIRHDKIISIFLKNSIPLTTNRFVLTALQSAEAILIPTFLLKYYDNSAISLTTYGVFTGMAFPFIMFPSTITNSLSTMLLPAVSNANSELKTNYISRLVERSVRFCLLIGIFSGLTFYIFGNTIGALFFNNKEAGIFLYQLSFLCPLIYLATTLASVLNGLGLATHNLMLTVLSTGIRLSFIIFVIPKIGITGYVIGLFVSYLFLTLASLKKMQDIILIELRFIRDLLSPLLFFAITGFLSYVIYDKVNVSEPFKIPYLLLVLTLYGGICFLTYVRTL